FYECRNRIGAMSLIHQVLYRSKDVAHIDFNNYLLELSTYLRQAYQVSGRRIVFKIGPCEILLSLDQSIAIGTVVCELLSNSLKHAFPDRKEGTISMDITALSGDRAELIVEDDGKGFDKEFDFENSQSLGLNIMRSTVRGQLDGTIKMESDGDVGTKYIIHFKAK
ncbi:MAG: sensor histidine kinase, partial [Cytophagales bacterium]|nr:sensor histidine kinase [Cytophagales bacterium]